MSLTKTVLTCGYHQQHEYQNPFSLSGQLQLGRIASAGTLWEEATVRTKKDPKLTSKPRIPTVDFDRKSDIDSRQGGIPPA
jgi:hypothetical protein